MAVPTGLPKVKTASPHGYQTLKELRFDAKTRVQSVDIEPIRKKALSLLVIGEKGQLVIEKAEVTYEDGEVQSLKA